MRNILTKFQRKSLKYPHILLTIDIPKLYIPNLNFKKLCNNIENRYMDFRNDVISKCYVMKFIKYPLSRNDILQN